MLGPSPDTVTLLKDQLLKKFTEETGVKVNIQQSEWASGFQKVTTAAASGTLADVTMLGGIWTAPIASKKALLPLDDHLSDWADEEKFYPALLEDCRWQDATYGLPLYTESRTALYRSDLIEQVGADTGSLPATWDDYKQLAGKLLKSNGGPVDVAADWFLDETIGLQQSFAQLLFQAGGTYWAPDGKAQFSAEPGVRALEYLVSFFADGLSDANLIYQGTGPKPLVAGEVAMNYSGYVEVANALANDPEVAPKLFAGTPLTADVGGKPATTAWVNKLGVSAKSKKPDAAVELIKFLVSADIAPQIASQYGGLPARQDLADVDYVKDLNPGYVGASEYVVPQPSHPNMLTIAPEINTAIQQAVRLDGKPADILKTLDERLDEINAAS
jgi:multiple sugar transport system substrate-binding protein